MIVVTYVTNSGQIVDIIDSPSTFEQLQLNTDADNSLLQIDQRINPNNFYVDLDTFEIASKSEISYTLDVTAIDADGVDVATITDLPDGCIATVNDESEQETEGVIVFGTDLAGVYQILLTHPLALDTTLEVTAA